MENEIHSLALSGDGTLYAGAMSQPMSYMIDGRQYVVIIAAGHQFFYRQKITGDIVAFALPE